MSQGHKGRPWTTVEKLALCISILEQSDATPDWASLEPPNGRTLRGTQRVWGEIKREVAAAAAATNSTGNSNGDDESLAGDTSATKPKGGSSPAKKAAVAKPKAVAGPAKEKAVRKPRVKNGKNGVTKSGRKRGSTNLETTHQDHEEPALKKTRLFEGGSEEAAADGKGKHEGKPAGNETRTGGEKTHLEDDDSSIILGGKGYQGPAVTDTNQWMGVSGDERDIAIAV
ncbi:hypothetical protein GP486_005293 [Trichoglossum hirsutum]|uniref:Uncharacterized protein n=1 Tax=Trichoglossum hirsutum TaxID=265104 RepID=A0A9P8RN14_9PEZI|nr:hypothetical protein GP486_005293 [Trichoglossum hirsutum]